MFNIYKSIKTVNKTLKFIYYKVFTNYKILFNLLFMR